MKLADYLSKNGLDAAKFARLIDVDKSTVSRWLKVRGSKVFRPDWDQLKRIALVTGDQVTADDFVDPPERCECQDSAQSEVSKSAA